MYYAHASTENNFIVIKLPIFFRVVKVCKCAEPSWWINNAHRAVFLFIYIAFWTKRNSFSQRGPGSKATSGNHLAPLLYFSFFWCVLVNPPSPSSLKKRQPPQSCSPWFLDFCLVFRYTHGNDTLGIIVLLTHIQIFWLYCYLHEKHITPKVLNL